MAEGYNGAFTGPEIDEGIKAIRDNKDKLVTVTSGASMSMNETIGEGPYTIEFDEESEGDIPASLVGYDNEKSSLTSTNVQDAIDEISESVKSVVPIEKGGTGVSSMVGTDYTVNRPRGIVLQSSEPDTVPNGCIVGVYE